MSAYATLHSVLARAELAPDLGAADLELARRIAGECTRYGPGSLPRSLFDAPSGRRIARMACEDVEGVRRLMDCFQPRETMVEDDTAPTPPRVIELSEGAGMVSLVLGVTWPDRPFLIHEDDSRRRWLWQRMAASLGLRNLSLLPVATRIAPGEWDVVLVKDAAPAKAMDLAGALLAEGGELLLWQDRSQAKGLRRRHLDARSRPLRLAGAVALESPVASGRLVARIQSPTDGLDSSGEAT